MNPEDKTKEKYILFACRNDGKCLGHWLPDGEHVSAETGLPSNSIAAPWPLVLWRSIEVLSDSRAIKNTHCGSSYEPSIGLMSFLLLKLG